jgi:hypothetical protein
MSKNEISQYQNTILKKELLKIGKIQFAQYQLSDDVDKRWYSSIGRSIHNQNRTTYTSIIRILLLSGDISTNPGPVKYPCGKCSKPVKRNQRGIYCEDCTYWC